MSQYGFSCARSPPQGLLEGELFQDWHENLSDAPVSVANVNDTNAFGRRNKTTRSIEHRDGVCRNISFLDKFMSNGDVSLQYSGSESKRFPFNIVVK